MDDGQLALTPAVAFWGMTDDLPLAAEFPPATREQWLKLVDGVLKGAPFESG